MRRVWLLISLVLVLARPAAGAEWQTIRPGDSTQASVRAQFGQPTRVTSQKVEGYDSSQWIYEGDQAPRGMTRATIDFGILSPQGYKADVVRIMNLEPRVGAFTRRTVIMGWGTPQGVRSDGDVESFFYVSGLIVRFDKDRIHVALMTFTPPQKLPEEPAPKRP